MKSRKYPWLPFFVAPLLVAAWLFSALPGASAEDDVDDIQDDIESVEEKLEKEQAKKNSIQSELNTINRSLATTEQAIRETQSHIDRTDEEIGRKQGEIAALEEEIAKDKSSLRLLLVDAYYDGSRFEVPELLSEDDFVSALTSPERYQTVGERIQAVIARIGEAKGAVESERSVLESFRSEKENLLKLKEDQHGELVVEQRSTKGDLAKQEATIGELQSKLSKLRSSLSDLLGSSYDAKDIEDAAKFASKATGVRRDFIMGMLVVESDLGRYTGGCDYKQSKMSSYRLEIFKNIAEDIGKNYKKLKVSCPPKSYSGTGGAMGVAQFMSDTWGDPDGSPSGYRKSIASATGHSHPDPWSLTDGVTAMALKLAKVPGVTDHKKSAERNAAKLYLSGTTSSKYDWYADKVLYWADNYERLLD